MSNYTRDFLLRITWLVVWFLTILALVTWWFQRSSNDSVDTSSFKPAQRIEQLKSLQAAIASAEQPSGSSTIGCNTRGQSILTIRTMDGFGLTVEQSEQMLKQLSQNIDFRMRCAEWIDHMQQLARYQQQSLQSIQTLEIDAALTEQVSWSRHVPCLYFTEENAAGLMMGKPIRCARHREQGANPLTSQEGSLREMMKITKSYLRNAPKEVIDSMQGSDHLFTLQPGLQTVMDRWASCLESKSCPDWPNTATAQHVSAVVMDAQSGDILAALCWSGPCDKPHMKALNHLGAFLVEAPPASTAKLLHSIALAQDTPEDMLMLQRQIKTSGQTDGSVSKRNEWWEKQVICNDNTDAPCQHSQRMTTVTEQLLWNQNCKGPSIACGRVSLIDQSNALILPGLLGHMRWSRSPHSPTRLLPWSDYDAIRTGKMKTDGSKEYLNTALAVQSVIGAGDARTSALGLAHLASQIERLAQGQGTQKPTLIRPWAERASSQTADRRTQTAAQTVLGGMRKVMEPAELGWKDPGTVANTLQRVLGQPCNTDCGMWGKTGTVSQQDRNFAGTTLFTGLVDTSKVHFWRHGTPAPTQGRMLAVGLIAIPHKGIKSTHLASELAMQFVKEVTSLPAQP